ncbi:hypothetical protein GGD62_007946 [Bradyrhizobium sp. ERR14]|nr:hypothetical protein [Bradyrhizobium sp. ERR14]
MPPQTQEQAQTIESWQALMNDIAAAIDVLDSPREPDRS